MINEYKSLRIIGFLIIVLIYKHFSHADKDISFGFHFWFVDGGLAISCRLSEPGVIPRHKQDNRPSANSTHHTEYDAQN